MNAFTNVNIDDEVEAYLYQASGPTPYYRPDPGQRKDLSWIMAGLRASYQADARTKLTMVALAYRYTGHGTSMKELKAVAHYTQSTLTSQTIYVRDSRFSTAATDMGRGRGDPRAVCIGHPCFNLVLTQPASAFSEE